MVTRNSTHIADILPDVGATTPSFVLRIVFGLVAVAVCWTQLTVLPWFIVGAVIAVAAAIKPKFMLGWVLILVLCVSVLWQEPSANNWRFYVLLAGVHLMHLLSAQLLWLPPRSRIQARALLPALRRFVIIQVPTQLGAYLLLSLLLGNRDAAGSLPIFAIVAALALILLVLVLTIPLLREKLEIR